MTNWVDKECKSVEWYTPEYILDCARGFFGGAIPLDPATTPNNRTEAIRFFAPEDDGLAQAWDAPVFVNPPYGKVFPDWCRKIGAEAVRGTQIVALLPCGARFSTGYWQTSIFNDGLDAWCFLRKRVKFVDQDGGIGTRNPYDSQLIGYNVNPIRFATYFKPLGACLTVEKVIHG